jgi:hypothetical protein
VSRLEKVAAEAWFGRPYLLLGRNQLLQQGTDKHNTAKANIGSFFISSILFKTKRMIVPWF